MELHYIFLGFKVLWKIPHTDYSNQEVYIQVWDKKETNSIFEKYATLEECENSFQKPCQKIFKSLR